MTRRDSCAGLAAPTPTLNGTATAYDRLLDRLREHGSKVAARGPDQATAQCPGPTHKNGDRNPSLSITRSRDSALLNCWAGCGTVDVMAALGLTMSDLFDNRREMTWTYADGRREHKRYDRNGRKQFYQPGSNGKTTMLYTMAEPSEQLKVIRAAAASNEPVLLVEGAKDVDAIMTQWPGTVAVSAPQGAQSLHLVDPEPLRGAQIIAIADNDDSGNTVWTPKAIAKFGPVARSLDFAHAKQGKDAADHINAGHTLAELLPWCPPEPEPAADQPESVLNIGEPIDWHALWADEEPDVQWLVEPLIAAGRLVSIYSAPKIGKSLLMLELAAGLASGRGVLGGPSIDPVRVLYVDFENDPRGDIRQRLKAMSYSPDDLDNLRYYSFPTLSALDSPLGGLELLRATRKERASLDIIDTVSRAVNGEENSNDTWLQFYRQTGLLLKREGVGCVRLDHSGKDAGKGQRGGSAKSGDVDAVWNLRQLSADLFTLKCEATRQLLPTDTLTLTRRLDPLRHELSGGTTTAARAVAATRLAECMKWLDDLNVPRDAGKPRCRTALQVAGKSVGNPILEEAIRQRKTAQTGLGQVSSDQLPTGDLGSSWAGAESD